MFRNLIASAALIAWLPAHAVTVAQWDFEGTTTPPNLSNSSASPEVAASTGTGFATGMHASAATDWSTPSGNGSDNAFSSNTWAVGDYWQFSFGTVGYRDLTLSFDQTSSNTGPREFRLSYSVAGGSFVDALDYSVLANAAPNPFWSPGTYQAAYHFALDLSAIDALDNQAAVVVRLTDRSTVAANGGSVALGGTDRIDNFTVVLTPVPEPGTWSLMFAGLAAVGFVARRRA